MWYFKCFQKLIPIYASSQKIVLSKIKEVRLPMLGIGTQPPTIFWLLSLHFIFKNLPRYELRKIRSRKLDSLTV